MSPFPPANTMRSSKGKWRTSGAKFVGVIDTSQKKILKNNKNTNINKQEEINWSRAYLQTKHGGYRRYTGKPYAVINQH